MIYKFSNKKNIKNFNFESKKIFEFIKYLYIKIILIIYYFSLKWHKDKDGIKI